MRHNIGWSFNFSRGQIDTLIAISARTEMGFPYGFPGGKESLEDKKNPREWAGGVRGDQRVFGFSLFGAIRICVYSSGLSSNPGIVRVNSGPSG